MSRWIKNYDELASTSKRSAALKIIEAGLDAIDTASVVKEAISLDGQILKVFGNVFDLSKYKDIYVIGFGKASCKAAKALEDIIGPKVCNSAVVGASKEDCKYIHTYVGTHPEPSLDNVEISKKIYELSSKCQEDDLVIVIVSGGGSALLCYPAEEYDQGKKLYQAFLNSGGTIEELNVVRKHISMLKGGGLAKVLYPATVIGLLFSDVPGNKREVIASGPTCKEESTVEDAKKIIDKYNLGEYKLIETPKEDKYFEKVHNFLLVSNENALAAMKNKAQELGFSAEIIDSQLYEFTENIVKIMKKSRKEVVLAGGETKLAMTKNGGKGGRNQQLSLTALTEIKENQLFISFASDGKDNSDAAGAIADSVTLKKAKDMDLDTKDYLERFDSYTFFEKTGDLIITGPTEANVSDLILLLQDNEN